MGTPHVSLLYSIASRFLGLTEVKGIAANPQIVTMLQLDNPALVDGGDEIPWCSAFVNYLAWLLDLPRSHSLAARSWMDVGEHVEDGDEIQGDIVVLKQAEADPGNEVVHFRGHVGLFDSEVDAQTWIILGGNQGNRVSRARFTKDRVLAVRRID